LAARASRSFAISTEESHVAHVERRPNGRWRARYRTPEGRARSKTFGRKADAERFLALIESEKLRGDFVDPHGGRRLFGDVVEDWLENHVQLRPTTLEQRESRLRVHVLPYFADRPIGAITRNEVQAWVNHRSLVMSPASVLVCYSYLAGVFKAALQDQLLARTPCRGIKLPRIDHPLVRPIPTAAVLRLADEIAPRYRRLVLTAAGTGMRQGECFGLTIDRVDQRRGLIVVDRQLVQLSRQLPFIAAPKTPAAYRTIPLPRVVATAIREQVEEYGTGTATDTNGRTIEGIVFTRAAETPIRRSGFNHYWRTAVKRAGLSTGTRFHELRHYYASVLIEAGESVKVIQARLGHKSATETLDTYGHLWPDTEARTQAAIDDAFGPKGDVDHRWMADPPILRMRLP
jgi:integrase